MRSLICATVAAVGMMSWAGTVWAEDDAYPNRAVKIVVGFQPGGPTDVVARLVAKALQEELKGAFVVENKPGATSNIASESVASAKPDGYTLLFAASPLVMNKFTYPMQKFDPVKSFEPISKISSAPGVLAATNKLPVKDYKEFEALAKKEPGKLNYGSTGNGGTQHMAMLKLQALTGIDMAHIPYGGGSGAMNDLIAGNIDVAFMTATGAMPALVAGTVHPLAVAGPKRLPELPNVPTFAELGILEMKSDSWNALLAPAGTPKPIVDKLAAVLEKAVKTKEFSDVLGPQGAMLIGNSPEEFRAELIAEDAYWNEQFKNVKLDK